MRRAEDYKVYAGVHNRLEKSEHTQVRSIEKVILPQDYKPYGWQNGSDIAILILTDAFVEDKIWIRHAVISNITPNWKSKCYYLGWGTVFSVSLSNQFMNLMLEVLRSDIL